MKFGRSAVACLESKKQSELGQTAGEGVMAPTFDGLRGQKANAFAGWKLALGLAFVMCLLLASSATLQAQSSTGTSVGTVTDSSGAAVAGATVTLTNVATGDARTAQTNGTGGYEFVNGQPAATKSMWRLPDSSTSPRATSSSSERGLLSSLLAAFIIKHRLSNTRITACFSYLGL
jgi:hypothetical protein